MEPGIMLFIRCKVDIFEQIKILKEIGVRRTFVNAMHPEIDKVLNAINDAGIICDNLHSEYQISYQDKKYSTQELCNEGIVGDMLCKKIMSNIDPCARNNIPVLVVHCPPGSPELSINEFSKKRYTDIGNYAREKGVTIAFENIEYTENLKYVMSLVPDAKFCWDCGHEYCHLSGEKPMPLFGKKLAALHIHDNGLTQDNHQIPFTSKVDFDEVGKQLAESGYEGTLMLEIMYGLGEGNSTEPTYKDFAIKAKLAAEKLIGIINDYRNS